MKVNGEDVNARVTRGRTVSYQPSELFERGATVQVELTYGETSHQWTFTTSTGEVAILITNVGEKESDLAIKARLEQVFGLDVLLMDDDTVDTSGGDAGKFLIDDAKALDVKLVYVSSPVNSNKAGAQPWHTSGIPLINVEQADIDNFQYAPGAGAIVSGDTVFVVATLPGGQAGLVGFDKGTELVDGTILQSRMAHLAITGDDQFRSFNENGLKLFDALVAWVMEIDPPSTEPSAFHFSPLVLQGGRVTLSWEGSATLQEAPTVSGPWRNSASQANPQTTAAIGTKFFRLVP